MTNSKRQVADLITEQAAYWLVANRAGLSVQERKEFGDWLKISPVHVEEYLAISMMSRDLVDASRMSDEPLDDLLARARSEIDAPIRPLYPRPSEQTAGPTARLWWTAAIASAATITLCVIGLGLWRLRSNDPPVAATETTARFTTRHGEQSSVRLQDGSVVHLNTDSAITVRYGVRHRTVTIDSGEADFEVAHEANRQFRVLAGRAEVVDIGTNFNVRLADNAAVVTVLVGRVAVSAGSPTGLQSPGPADLHWIRVSAGQQVKLAADSPATPATVDTHRVTAWLHRQISFEHEPLERVVTEFNRYVSKPIEITTPVLRKLEISGVFATDDVTPFLAFLRSLDGVRVDETATQIRVSQR
jgi:transmembrane sensor